MPRVCRRACARLLALLLLSGGLRWAAAKAGELITGVAVDETEAGITFTVTLAEDNSNAPAVKRVQLEHLLRFGGRGVEDVRAPAPSTVDMTASAPPNSSSWSVTVPTEGVKPGSLFMYSVRVLDRAGILLDFSPAKLDETNTSTKTGWVVGWKAINDASSAVPPLFWFTTEAERSRWDTPTLGSVAFGGDGKLRYYGTVMTHREGSGRNEGNVKLISSELKSKDWPKRKFRMTFVGKHFKWREDAPRVKHISLRSMYQESGPVSYIREALALRVLKDAGVPSSEARYVRLIQNGTFVGLYLMLEEIDKRWLVRRNFSNETLLFKSNHWKYSNLRSPDERLDCPQTTPDQDYAGKNSGRGRNCPAIYPVVNPKLPASDRRYDRLINEFAVGLQNVNDRVAGYGVNDSFVKGFWDLRVDRKAIINEMAVQTLMLNVDRCTKNHYWAKTLPDGRWFTIPEDVEDAFATDSRKGYRNCSAEGWDCRDPYCYLSCAETNSIFMCDRTHPQDSFERSTFNHMVDAVIRYPVTKAEYFTRLREVTDKYSKSGWLERQVKAIQEEIGPSAREDAALWNTTSNWDDNVAQLLAQIQTRRGQLYAQLAVNTPPPAPPSPPPRPSPPVKKG